MCLTDYFRRAARGSAAITDTHRLDKAGGHVLELVVGVRKSTLGRSPTNSLAA
jgi:hypothetical protein